MAWTIATSVVLALLRITGHKSQTFQAVAHLWIGYLAGSWFVLHRPLDAWCVGVLSAIELVCFIIFRNRKPR